MSIRSVSDLFTVQIFRLRHFPTAAHSCFKRYISLSLTLVLSQVSSPLLLLLLSSQAIIDGGNQVAAGGFRSGSPPTSAFISGRRRRRWRRRFVSDDDRSVVADSWSMKSEFGSTFDDEQRHVDASEVLCGANFRAASDYSSDKDDVNKVESMLGLQSYWDASYAEDLANYREHGQAGEIWFGAEVMDNVASWTKNLCLNMFQHPDMAEDSTCKSENRNNVKELSTWSVLDIGTGNGLLLHELGKKGLMKFWRPSWIGNSNLLWTRAHWMPLGCIQMAL